jgi:hypothetical protein
MYNKTAVTCSLLVIISIFCTLCIAKFYPQSITYLVVSHN